MTHIKFPYLFKAEEKHWGYRPRPQPSKCGKVVIISSSGARQSDAEGD